MSVKESLPINWTLISHPANWVVLFLMVAIAGLAFHFLLGNAPQQTGSNSTQQAQS